MNIATFLFVYGTLTPDGGAWKLLEPWIVGAPEPAAVPGTLYDTGRGYPAATFEPGSAGLVHGVVVVLDACRSEAALTALDRYEAHEYARIEVLTASGLPAVTYAWTAPLDQCVALPGGRWRGARKVR
jgi:gamma-glutamylcyclotransferase (GGCT)/AIG2-like uncharacterized protein YtfP